METSTSSPAKRKGLALTGMAAAAAVLTSQSDRADAQGYYQYSQNLGNASVLYGNASNDDAIGQGNTITVSLPGLNTVQPVSYVQFFETGEITFSQVATNNSWIYSYTYSETFTGYLQLNQAGFGTLNAEAQSATSSTVGNNIFGTSYRTYFYLSSQIFNYNDITGAGINNYVHEGTQGNYGDIAGLTFDVYDDSYCSGGITCSGQGFFIEGVNIQLYVTYGLADVPGPGALAVLLPGFGAGLIALKRRRRARDKQKAA